VNVGDSSAFQYEYHEMRIPAFPTLHCEVALEIAPEPGKVWVPIRAICEDALHIDNSSQQAKIREDERFAHCRRLVPFKTVKGFRESHALEFEGFIPWLTEIEESRVDPGSAGYIRTFRKFAWAFLSRLSLDSRVAAIAEGRAPERALPPPIGLGSAVVRPFSHGQQTGRQMLEARVDALEEAVFVTGPSEGDVRRTIRCVNCGCEMQIVVDSFRTVPARHDGES
jgi:hypothetical protein